MTQLLFAPFGKKGAKKTTSDQANAFEEEPDL